MSPPAPSTASTGRAEPAAGTTASSTPPPGPARSSAAGDCSTTSPAADTPGRHSCTRWAYTATARRPGRPRGTPRRQRAHPALAIQAHHRQHHLGTGILKSGRVHQLQPRRVHEPRRRAAQLNLPPAQRQQLVPGQPRGAHHHPLGGHLHRRHVHKVIGTHPRIHHRRPADGHTDHPPGPIEGHTGCHPHLGGVGHRAHRQPLGHPPPEQTRRQHLSTRQQILLKIGPTLPMGGVPNAHHRRALRPIRIGNPLQPKSTHRTPTPTRPESATPNFAPQPPAPRAAPPHPRHRDTEHTAPHKAAATPTRPSTAGRRRAPLPAAAPLAGHPFVDGNLRTASALLGPSTPGAVGPVQAPVV